MPCARLEMGLGLRMRVRMCEEWGVVFAVEIGKVKD